MAKPPLSMKPTGWFQVAWSAEIGIGEVRCMKYFDTEMIAWRSAAGAITVMDAYCEHLGAHLGHGGHVDGDRIVCPFHGWEWNSEGRNVCIPYERRPNRGRRIRSYPVAELNESIFLWHDVDGGAPYFDVPDVLAGFDDDSTAADYYPAATLLRHGLELHPQYVMENGVDFAHFAFVHKVPFMPDITRHDFTLPTSYVDFTIAFDENTRAEDVNSGVRAVNAGLGVAATKSWGMVDNRTLTAVTPVDDSTSDVRFSVWIGRRPGDTSTELPTRAKFLADAVIEQFTADIRIWSHQRYCDPPALTQGEYDGFTQLREWAKQFYPEDRAAIETTSRRPGPLGSERTHT
ncbi:Rieske 2Fe-2S domain-containing protein [Nocardia sp. NPDC005366]|uniref:Rieske 2Fe-2S domain-containing protein n=1 Tax=Nocardia sp. NPDC005366 TaxID=3156878 RepID=UPI0033AC058B